MKLLNTPDIVASQDSLATCCCLIVKHHKAASKLLKDVKVREREQHCLVFYVFSTALIRLIENSEVYVVKVP